MSSEIIKLHKDLVAKKISCTALVQERLEALTKNTNNSANLVLHELALELAAKTDAKIKNGETIGLLEGIPFGVKDVFLLQGHIATGSSGFLTNYVSPYTATAIQKLMDAGAIPLVKENCDSFGHGSTNENSVFGPAKNAHDDAIVAGGSSGGSAVNVAKKYTAFSIGGDTGGSIRQPAGYNKVYGLKPSYGRVSRFGIMAYASSTDCVGPIASTLDDIRIVLNVISGKDGKDQTTYVSAELPELTKSTIVPTTLKVGYYKNFIDSPSIDPKIKADFLAMIAGIKKQGVEVKELACFNDDILVATYYVLAMAETASNLSRLDGTTYGQRNNNPSIKEGYLLTRSENFSAETRRRIIGGNQVLSQGHAEEIYKKARQLRSTITESYNKDFTTVDVILSPVAPCQPPQIGHNLSDPLTMYLSDAYTVGFSIAGLPTLTAPLYTDSGIQITAAHNQEEKIFAFTHFLKEL